MTQRSSSCQTCGAPILYATGGYSGPPGWYDPATVDEDNTGTSCPISGDEHLPGEVQTG